MTTTDELEAATLRLRHALAGETVLEKFAVFAAAYKANFDPNQPRAPAGNPDGGQWTRVGGDSLGGGTVLDGPSSVGAVYADAGQVLSDTDPDPIRPGAQYAQVNHAPTGFSTIDEKTDSFLETLARVSDSLPSGIGPAHGVAVHVEFAAALRMQNLRGVSIEQSFNAGSVVRYGLDDSIRTDVVLRNDQGDIVAIYDVKVNTATLRPSRAEELRAKTGARHDVPVIELHVRRGATMKHADFETHSPGPLQVMGVRDVDGGSCSRRP